jgi:hypothetical protein
MRCELLSDLELHLHIYYGEIHYELRVALPVLLKYECVHFDCVGLKFYFLYRDVGGLHFVGELVGLVLQLLCQHQR